MGIEVRPLLTLVSVVLVLVAAFFFVSRSKKEISGNWIQFFAKGKEAGFSFKETEMLRRLASRCNIENPCSLFSSQEQLDTCISSMVRGMRMSGESEEQGTQNFLSRLYDYRKKIEMNKPVYKTGITSSRQMVEGQTLRVLVSGTGVFRSEVVKVIGSYLTITRPVNNKITASVSWLGMKLSVYFWREDDAGYVFDTAVIDEVFSRGIPSLKIEHSDSLFRTQKRRSVRIKMHKAAFLYLANDYDVPGRLEMDPGLKCILEDLSDTGCAVITGGQAAVGLRVKVQFALDNVPICILGTVRSVDFKEETNRSIMHIEADTLPIEMRNHILGEVFGMLSEDDDDELPFHMLDEEAANISSQMQNNNTAPETPDTADNNGKAH
ncbi:MAG: PilZ domain-containing protein [Treponema sp.]|nr:PilZ domain-containing protein [Treponema sp.]